MRRERSYQDLSSEEKQRYDRLRAIERRVRDPGSARAKRCGSRGKRYLDIKRAADAMLGLQPDLYTFVDPEPKKTKPWIGSTTTWAPGARP